MNKIKNNYLGNIKTSSELNIDGKYEIKTSLESLYIIQGDKKIMDIFGSNEDNDFYREYVVNNNFPKEAGLRTSTRVLSE